MQVGVPDMPLLHLPFFVAYNDRRLALLIPCEGEVVSPCEGEVVSGIQTVRLIPLENQP